VDDRGIGELVVTTLTNDIMPLLRYRLGDWVAEAGRLDGTEYLVHGRVRDGLNGPAGRRVTTWEVDQCFAGVGGVAHYQMRQTGDGRLVCQFIPDGSGPVPADLELLRDRLEALLRPAAAMSLELVELLPPTPSGKFRLTCRV
jgi:phenylacetate-CoA ligase